MTRLNPQPVPQYGHVVDTYLISIVLPLTGTTYRLDYIINAGTTGMLMSIGGDLHYRAAWTTSAAASVTSPATERGRV